MVIDDLLDTLVVAAETDAPKAAVAKQTAVHLVVDLGRVGRRLVAIQVGTRFVQVAAFELAADQLVEALAARVGAAKPAVLGGPLDALHVALGGIAFQGGLHLLGQRVVLVGADLFVDVGVKLAAKVFAILVFDERNLFGALAAKRIGRPFFVGKKEGVHGLAQRVGIGGDLFRIGRRLGLRRGSGVGRLIGVGRRGRRLALRILGATRDLARTLTGYGADASAGGSTCLDAGEGVTARGGSSSLRHAGGRAGRAHCAAVHPRR